MNILEAVSAMLQEIAPADETIVAVLQIADDGWVVTYNDDLDVELEFDTGSNRIVLSSYLGEPSDERRLSVCETLMMYSTMWRDTGGVCMGLTGPGGGVVMMADLAASETTGELLLSVLSNFAQKARLWREFVEKGGSGQSASDDSLLHTIRV